MLIKAPSQGKAVYKSQYYEIILWPFNLTLNLFTILKFLKNIWINKDFFFKSTKNTDWTGNF